MVSAIDATKPADGIPASKADLRSNLATAKNEIETLQGDLGGVFRLSVSVETAATVVIEDTDERNYLVLTGGVNNLEISDSLALGVVLNGVNESGGDVRSPTINPSPLSRLRRSRFV